MINKINWGLVSSILCLLCFFNTCSRTTTSDIKKQNKVLAEKVDSMGTVIKEYQKNMNLIMLDVIPDAAGYKASAVMGAKENNERNAVAETKKKDGKDQLNRLK